MAVTESASRKRRRGRSAPSAGGSPVNPAREQPRAPSGSFWHSREASGNSPSSTPNVAGPERRGWSSILIPSSIFEQSDWPRVKHLSKDSGPVAISMGRPPARPGAPERRGEALPGGGAGSAPRLAEFGGTLRPGGGRRFYFYLGDMRSVSCLDFQRRGAEEGAGAAAHGGYPRYTGAHMPRRRRRAARGVTCSPAAPRPPRRALPGPGRAERRGGAGRGGGASPALRSPCAMRRPEEPRRLEQGPRRRNTPPGASPLLKLADI